MLTLMDQQLGSSFPSALAVANCLAPCETLPTLATSAQTPSPFQCAIASSDAPWTVAQELQRLSAMAPGIPPGLLLPWACAECISSGFPCDKVPEMQPGFLVYQAVSSSATRIQVTSPPPLSKLSSS